MRRSTLTMTFDPLVSPTRRISPPCVVDPRRTHTSPNYENAASAMEWPLLPVSEVMPAREWRDGHVFCLSDNPNFERISVLELCDEYFFHGVPDGPVCHRVAALARDPEDDSHLTCAAVISMSDVVRTSIREHLDAAPDEVATLADDVTVADLGLVAAPPFTVDAHRPALRAFEDMLAAGFTCAAVVCATTGNVVDTMDAADVRGVLPDRVRLLAAPTREFLVAARAASSPSRPRAAGTAAEIWPGPSSRDTRHEDATVPRPPIFCRPSTTFADAVRLMTDFGVRHAFVADERAPRTAGTISARHLVGVITLTDVLRRACFEDAHDARGTGSDGT